MTNEQLRQRAQEIADEHGNDAYSVALAMLDGMNKIKAEAVLEAIEECRYNGADGQGWGNDLEQYANKLENQND